MSRFNRKQTDKLNKFLIWGFLMLGGLCSRSPVMTEAQVPGHMTIDYGSQNDLVSKESSVNKPWTLD